MNRRQFIRMLSNLGLFLGLGSMTISCSKHNKQLHTNNATSKEILIIGSGITGLCLGAIATKLGNTVTLLEKHEFLLGGHARTLDIGQHKFCVGPQYVWDFNGTDKDIGSNILRYLGIFADNPFVSLNKNGFDRVFIGEDKGLDIPIGLDKFKKKLIEKFPSEKLNLENIFRNIHLLHRVSTLLSKVGLNKSGTFDMSLYLLTSGEFTISEKIQLLFLSRKTVEEFFVSHDISKKCKLILYANSAIFAENMESLSVGIYAAAIGNYHKGATYPKRGFDQLVNSLSQLIVDGGGKILLGKKVTNFVTYGNMVKGVTCADGSSYFADIVISNLSPRITCSLLNKCDLSEFTYTPSNSLFCTFITVKNYDVSKLLNKKNFWWNDFSRSIDFEKPDMTELPTALYACSPSTNIVRQHNTTNSQTITIFSPGNFRQAKEQYVKGINEYQIFKDKCVVAIIDQLESVFFPNICDFISNISTLSPFDIYQEIGAELGNVYGKRMNIKNIKDVTKSLKKYRNLHVACATVSQPGIATAFQTAALLSEKLFATKI